MPANVMSCALHELDGLAAQVDVDGSRGMTGFTVIGLPDDATKESRLRVRSAVRDAGLLFANKRFTINLAPADIRRERPAYHLPIAVGVSSRLNKSGQGNRRHPHHQALSLDVSVHHIDGVLPVASLARDEGISTVLVPIAGAREATLITHLTVIPVQRVRQLAAHMQGLRETPPYEPDDDPMTVYHRRTPPTSPR